MPSWGAQYSISRTELVVLEEWLAENLSKGFIQQSSSPFMGLVVFGMIADGGL